MSRLTAIKPRIAGANRRTLHVATHDRIRGRALQTIRAAHFRQYPLCVLCLERGITRLAVILDHKIALENGGLDAEINRQGLCQECHDAKTLLDNAIARGQW